MAFNYASNMFYEWWLLVIHLWGCYKKNKKIEIHENWDSTIKF